MIAREVAIVRTVIAFMVVTLSMDAVAQEGHGGPSAGGPFLSALAAIRDGAAGVNREAMRVYETLPREGSCKDRRANWLAVLPDALLLGRYARDIYDARYEATMRETGRERLALAEDHFAYFEIAGERYAEVHLNQGYRRAIVVFRGTRLNVRSDVGTDLLNFVGIETSYYDWAASLVARIVREHPDLEVVTTGHSLGGGLALYAVLRNPGVRGFVFNPTGLSEATWSTVSPLERARVSAAMVVITQRNLWSIEPATALSFAGRSVLPGHIFVLSVAAILPTKLHAATTMVTALEDVVEHQAEGFPPPTDFMNRSMFAIFAAFWGPTSGQISGQSAGGSS